MNITLHKSLHFLVYSLSIFFRYKIWHRLVTFAFATKDKGKHYRKAFSRHF